MVVDENGTQHPTAGDGVTAEGMAHIAGCRRCQDVFPGLNLNGPPVIVPAGVDLVPAPPRLPDLGILARITREELVSILDALGLDAATIGTVTIRPDSIYLTGFDPATSRPTDRRIEIGEFPEPEDLPSPGPGWHVVPGCKCGHPMAQHLNALGCMERDRGMRCGCWTYEAREARP